MERIPVSSRMLVRCTINPQIRTHRWRTRKLRKNTNHLLHTSQPFGDNPDEEPNDDLSKPGKVHYHSEWKNTQDAVYWINLARAQDKGLRFWQTRSHAAIVHSAVPADCIYKVISQTLDASSRTDDCTQKCLAIAAAATAAAQDTSESASSSTRKLERRVRREEQGQREEQR